MLLTLASVLPVLLACPACGRASEQTQGAYVLMTVVMSLLPLSAIGGVVWWVARGMRE